MQEWRVFVLPGSRQRLCESSCRACPSRTTSHWWGRSAKAVWEIRWDWLTVRDVYPMWSYQYDIMPYLTNFWHLYPISEFHDIHTVGFVNHTARCRDKPYHRIQCIHTTSHHITSHHTTPHHIISYHIISYHITSHHTTPHHITSHHITTHHTTLHHTTLNYTTLHHTYVGIFSPSS